MSKKRDHLPESMEVSHPRDDSLIGRAKHKVNLAATFIVLDSLLIALYFANGEAMEGFRTLQDIAMGDMKSALHNWWQSSRNRPFKHRFSHNDRRVLFQSLSAKYPGRIPVIVERASGSILNDFGGATCYFKPDQTCSSILQTIRKRIKLPPSSALFVLVNGRIPSPDTRLDRLQQDHADADGFLYVTYSGESMFG